MGFHEHFKKAAETLLNGATLFISGKKHRFVELEFYYCHPKHHNDIFAHRDEYQKRCGIWYFHRTGKGFKGGSYKGLDIAFGNNDAHGGILIRGIHDLENKKLIDGPSLCVDHILKTTGKAT